MNWTSKCILIPLKWHTPYTIHLIIRVALYKNLRKTEIYKDGSNTQEDLQYNQYYDNPFKSFSVGRIDTLLEEFEHILKDLPSQSRHSISSDESRGKEDMMNLHQLEH
jgi:hypothetical protein